MSNLQLRILAGIGGGTLIVGSIFYSQWSYFLIFLLIAQFCLFEFYRLFQTKNIHPNIIAGIVISLFNYVLMFFVKCDHIGYDLFALNIPLVMVVFITELYRKKDNPFLNMAITLFGNVYITLPFVLMHVIAFHSGVYSFGIVLIILLMLWANDTGAFAFGKLMGRNKLFERISPNKTWEGFLGGILLASVVGTIAYFIYPDQVIYKYIALSLLVAVAATFGDLFESLLKRSLKIKDSGSIIPGHGGFLDRFDGLLLILPLVHIYFTLTHF